jgi:death-on-curing protein
MRYISLGQVLQLHRRIIEESGGTLGILNLGALESALHWPRVLVGLGLLGWGRAMASIWYRIE